MFNSASDIENSKSILLKNQDGSPLIPITVSDNVIGIEQYTKFEEVGHASFIGTIEETIEGATVAAHDAADRANEAADRADMAATPSGDPMHYMYENMGAIWNNTTHFWELNTLVDLTNNDMRNIAMAGPTKFVPSEYRYSNIRTNANAYNNIAEYGSCERMFASSSIEVAVIGTESNPINAGAMFMNCENLVNIIGILNLGDATYINSIFKGCTSLETVNIKNLKYNLILSDSVSFSLESIAYIINNSAATSPITIVLHPDVYAQAIEDTSIQTALTSKINLSISHA